MEECSVVRYSTLAMTEICDKPYPREARGETT